MKTFKQYLKEAFDKPYKYKRESRPIKTGAGTTDHHYSFEDRNGRKTHVFFSHYKHKNGEIHSSVDFTDDNFDIGLTGKGTIKHLSTVSKIMRDHAAKHPKLKMYHFTGEKDSDKPDEGGRNRLYTKLTKLNGGYSEYLNAYSNKHFIPVNRDK